MSKIIHDAEMFAAEIAVRVYDESVTDAIDVITRDGEPETLLAVVRSLIDFDVYYSNQKYYKTYQHAYAAIGAAIDKANPEHRPLNTHWAE
ncbi:hypothetical protein [Halomonas citrativorans]|uniref:hypothetical protein n=1 Tax=Halomonas TaxID=2745 RepID=UPI0018679DE8|nr:hypothetical protein [Halomonas citrativorans]